MVTVSNRHIIAQPNCSASWGHNQRLLAVLGLWGMAISAVFCLQGAWLVLPLVIAELLLLASTLVIVGRKIHQRHVLRFQQQELTVEKGHRCPAQCWHLALASTRISVERQAQPFSPPKIYLCTAAGEKIAVGDFLNCQDSQSLLSELRQQGLAVCNDSPTGSLKG